MERDLLLRSKHARQVSLTENDDSRVGHLRIYISGTVVAESDGGEDAQLHPPAPQRRWWFSVEWSSHGRGHITLADVRPFRDKHPALGQGVDQKIEHLHADIVQFQGSCGFHSLCPEKWLDNWSQLSDNLLYFGDTERNEFAMLKDFVHGIATLSDHARPLFGARICVSVSICAFRVNGIVTYRCLWFA